MYQECIACSGRLEHTTISGLISPSKQVPVQKCASCGGIHFSGYLGDSYEVVAHHGLWDGTATTYFDLDVLSSRGPIRIHGWMDAQRRMVQEG